jgi:uncharacterized membrane protein YcaP (DUF421 family)
MAGRKSIAQMTLAQTVLMISLGTIIVQPIIEKSLAKAVMGAAIFVLVVLLLEYLQLKFNAIETLIAGKSKVVIENGQLNVENLKKLRLTVDQLETRMRQQGIAAFADIKIATLEPNGQFGYELKEDAKPLTVGEFKKWMGLLLAERTASVQPPSSLPNNEQTKQDLFAELTSSKPQGHKYLQ